MEPEATTTTKPDFNVGDRVGLRYNSYYKPHDTISDRESNRECFIIAMGDVENTDKLVLESWSEGKRDGYTALYRIQFLLDGGDLYIRRLKDVNRYAFGKDDEQIEWQDWQINGKNGEVFDIVKLDRERAEEPPFECPECGHKLPIASETGESWNCWTKNGGCGRRYVGQNGETPESLPDDERDKYSAWMMEEKRERGLLGEYERGWPGHNPFQ